ncbi:uncharacterized protein LOC119766535 isoform X1 [Culex quinquefasciatus]|uniref:uncharacterized protein LOC119766535 isoform X1 n=1 Tax=Culex quinquefasciatus TaxID=7176 RepID=UPI0018E2EAB4|nr:uncharacterized protein LOC119766535 isoform X1 [Culex quinquefasciatus]
MQDEFAGRSACDREHGRDFGATNPPPPPQRSRSSSPELPNPSPSTIPEPAAPPKPRRKTAKKNYAASQVDMFLSSESSEDEEVNLDPSADCSSCNWKTKYLKLAAGHDKLKKKLNSTKVQRNRLMQSLTSDLLNEPKTFTTEEGFPPIVQLQAMANTTRKPYCFVRTLMQEIWPRGFGNKTVTGNPSKNCLGRPSRSSKSASRQSPREVDGALEANKVKYLRDRLVEFLTLQGTDVATAADIVYSQSGKWFSQIICLYNKKGKW